jgi:oxygen-dependent protoporphyrinogen oxidase
VSTRLSPSISAGTWKRLWLENHVRIAIIGAGISGLASAFYLNRIRPEWELVIFDANTIPGGTMQTVEIEGFRFEAGGNGFLTNKPDSLQLIEDADAEHLLLQSSELARKRYIYTDRLHRLPESPPLFLKSKLLSWPQKLRVAGELLVPARRDDRDESLQAFGYRRLGKGFTDVFLDAMTAGIYATTPDKVSVQAAFPLVVRLEREHGGLFKGMIARRKRRAGPGGILMSFKGGVSRFIEHLHEVIPAQWRLGDPVQAVRRDDESYTVISSSETSRVDRVVVSTPAFAAAQMLSGLDPRLAALVGRIEYSPITVVGFGYRELDHPLDGFGLLTTTGAHKPVLGVLWDSSIFPDRAPPDGKLLRTMIGGQRDPTLVDRSESELIEMARDGLRATMGIDAEPDVTYVHRWRRGIPNYPVGHLELIDRIDQALARHEGLQLNSNAYRGIAMNDCVRNARELAARMAAS